MGPTIPWYPFRFLSDVATVSALILFYLCPVAVANLETTNELIRKIRKVLNGRLVTVGVLVDTGNNDFFSTVVRALGKGVRARYGGISISQLKWLADVFNVTLRWLELPKGLTLDSVVEGVGNGTFTGVDIVRTSFPLCISPFCV